MFNDQTCYDVIHFKFSLFHKTYFCVSQVAEYKLEVTARDRGFISNAAVTSVFIKVLDVNDNFPVFSIKNYSAIVQVKYFYVCILF